MPSLPQDPKTSRWLWDLRERARQKKRTEHFRQIMRLQQESADPLASVDMEDTSQVSGRETAPRLAALLRDNVS